MKVLKTEADYRNAHREMWDWLAKNPAKDKTDWPGWDYNGGEYYSECFTADCFACAFMPTGSCCKRACPIWKHSPDGKSYCANYGSWYWQHLQSEGTERTRLARLIRDAWPNPEGTLEA